MFKSFLAFGRQSANQPHRYSGRAILTATAFCLGITATGSANAMTYTYQGDIFTSQSAGVVGVHRLTATVDINPLEPMNSSQYVWEITGIPRSSLSNSDPSQIEIFDLTFDANKNIIAWNIEIFFDVGNQFILQARSSNLTGDRSSTSFVIDTDECNPPEGNCDFDSNSGRVSTPGTWSPTFGANVPEPATWAMMLMGFGGIGAALRRRASLTPTPA